MLLGIHDLAESLAGTLLRLRKMARLSAGMLRKSLEQLFSDTEKPTDSDIQSDKDDTSAPLESCHGTEITEGQDNKDDMTSGVIDMITALFKPWIIAPAQPSMPQLQKDCTFLSLPSEIRNRICKLAIIEETRHVVAGPCTANDGYEVEPALTRTCQQLRDECLPMFYENNTFHVIYQEFSARSIRPLAWDIDKVKHIEVQLPRHSTIFHLQLDKRSMKYNLQTDNLEQDELLRGPFWKDSNLDRFRTAVKMAFDATLANRRVVGQFEPVVLQFLDIVDRWSRQLDSCGEDARHCRGLRGSREAAT